MLKLYDSLARSIRTGGITVTIQKISSRYSRGTPDFRRIERDGFTWHLIAQDSLTSYLESGAWEAHLHQVFGALLSDGDNAIDLGANFGAHTLKLASLVGSGQVFAIEPLSLTFSQLQLNVVANRLPNVTAYKFAASDVTGDYIEMDRIYYGRKALNIGNSSVGSGGDGALSIRIDDLPLPPIRLAKIDIQGSEMRALLGMEALIARDRPILAIEIEEHHLRRFGTSSKAVIEHLLARGYVLFRINSAYPCDHVAVPAESADEVEAKLAAAVSVPLTRIAGKQVRLRFATTDSPNYETLEVVG